MELIRAEKRSKYEAQKSHEVRHAIMEKLEPKELEKLDEDGELQVLEDAHHAVNAFMVHVRSIQEQMDQEEEARLKQARETLDSIEVPVMETVPGVGVPTRRDPTKELAKALKELEEQDGTTDKALQMSVLVYVREQAERLKESGIDAHGLQDLVKNVMNDVKIEGRALSGRLPLGDIARRARRAQYERAQKEEAERNALNQAALRDLQRVRSPSRAGTPTGSRSPGAGGGATAGTSGGGRKKVGTGTGAGQKEAGLRVVDPDSHGGGKGNGKVVVREVAPTLTEGLVEALARVNLSGIVGVRSDPGGEDGHDDHDDHEAASASAEKTPPEGSEGVEDGGQLDGGGGETSSVVTTTSSSPDLSREKVKAKVKVKVKPEGVGAGVGAGTSSPGWITRNAQGKIQASLTPSQLGRGEPVGRVPRSTKTSGYIDDVPSTKEVWQPWHLAVVDWDEKRVVMPAEEVGRGGEEGRDGDGDGDGDGDVVAGGI